MMTATEFHTAEEKELALEQLKAFLGAGCPRRGFTRLLYDYASNMYGHTAEYSRDGYWDAWFSSPQKIQRWLHRATSHGVYGDPAFTRSDVELALAGWVRASGIERDYDKRVADEIECAERAELVRLQDKYGARV